VFGCKRGAMAAAVAAVGLLIAAPSAIAIPLYAASDGSMTSNCTSPDPMDANPPCTLTRAISVAATADEVILAPGDYDLGSNGLIINKAISVHGADGQARPRILSSAANFGVAVNNAAASLRRVGVEYSGPLEALDNFNSAVVEQVIVHATVGIYACLAQYDSTLRDSVCWNSASGGIGTVLQSQGDTTSANLRNVTTVATGTGSYGLQVQASNSSDQQTAVAKNVIADGVSFDVRAVGGSAGSIATITLSNSNYASEQEVQNSGTASVTDPGTGTGNQTGAPVFTDAGTGLFHQAGGSPTIDAGATVDLMGNLDIDGDSRSLGAAPDIGADEFIPVPASLPPPALLPTTLVPFDLAAAIRKCKKKFPKGSKKRKRCIRKAKARAQG
jgi:hypothetical protein